MVYVSKPVWHIPLLCVQWNTPDDGQRNCPKHVEFNSKNKFEKLVHLVAFIIRNVSRCTVTWTSNTLLLYWYVFQNPQQRGEKSLSPFFSPRLVMLHHFVSKCELFPDYCIHSRPDTAQNVWRIELVNCCHYTTWRCTPTPAPVLPLSSLWCDGQIPTAHWTSP
jgi:hypothetical protein